LIKSFKEKKEMSARRTRTGRRSFGPQLLFAAHIVLPHRGYLFVATRAGIPTCAVGATLQHQAKQAPK